MKQERGVSKCDQGSSSMAGDCEMKLIDMRNDDVIILEPHEVKPIVRARDSKKQFRGNLVKTFRIFETIRANIRAEHVAAMKRTPFFNFWLPFLNGEMKKENVSKSDIVLRKMISRYSVRERGFRFGAKILKLTAQDVDLVFGIKSGTIELGLDNSSSKPDSEFARRRAALIHNDSMEVSEINRELAVLVNSHDEVDMTDFVKLLCAHSLYTVFDSSSGIVVPNWIISIVDDLEGLNRIAWNKYVVDKLNSSLIKCHLVPENTIGCVLLLGYIMLEHSDLVAPINPNGIPRFTKWKMLDLKEEYMDLDDVIISMKVDVAPLVKTDEEAAQHGFTPAVAPCGLTVSVQNVGYTNGEGSTHHRNRNICAGKTPVVCGRSQQSTDVNGGAYPFTLEEMRNEFSVMRDEMLPKRCDVAENRYYNEVAIRREVETCLEDSIVEAEVHSITQAISEDKTFSALKDEIAAKDQIIADMRDQIKARDLNREFNNISPNFSANRVNSDLVQAGVGSPTMINNAPVFQQRSGHSSSSATLVGSGSSSKQGSANVAMIPSETKNEIPCSDFLTQQPGMARFPNRQKRSARSIERGVKFNPRQRQKNKKYEDVEPVAFGVINPSGARILSNDKDSYEVGNYMTAADFSILQLSYLADRSGLKDVLYTAPKSEHKVIRVEDVYDILVKHKISNQFIEGLNEMLSEYISFASFIQKMSNRKKISQDIIGPKILFMPANTWTYVSGGWTGCLVEIHEKLDQHAENPVDNIVVPLNSSGQGNYGSLHWTLMIFCVKSKIWTFYNSLPIGNSLDDHRLDAVIVAKYLETYMRHGQVTPQMTSGVHVNLQIGNCPKQDPEKPDCGVFMCYVLKQLIDGKEIAGKLQNHQLLNVRAHMIHWAVNNLI